MKSIAVILTLSLVSATASASFFQKTCSSANGLTKTAGGHGDSYRIITQVKYENGQKIETPISIDYNNHDTKVVKKVTLSDENSKHCYPNGNAGIGSWKTLTFEKIVITKNNGELFPEGVSGVSSDRTEVTADLICEEEGNSQIFCD